MSQFDTTALVSLVDRPVTGGVISSADHEAWRNDVELRVSQLNSAAQALQTNNSGATAPANNTIRGQIWADTSNANRVILKVDPSGAGTTDEILTRLEAYRLSLATGGTATFKPSGIINVNTTQVSKAGSTGVLQTYTVPANTLDANGKYIHVVAFGTKTGTTATMTLQPRFGTTALASMVVAANCADWCIEFWIVRTGVGTQDCGAYMVLNRDDTGGTVLCKGLANPNKDETTGLAVDVNLSAVNAADGATGEILIVEYGGGP